MIHLIHPSPREQGYASFRDRNQISIARYALSSQLQVTATMS